MLIISLSPTFNTLIVGTAFASAEANQALIERNRRIEALKMSGLPKGNNEVVENNDELATAHQVSPEATRAGAVTMAPQPRVKIDATKITVKSGNLVGLRKKQVTDLIAERDEYLVSLQDAQKQLKSAAEATEAATKSCQELTNTNTQLTNDLEEARADNGQKATLIGTLNENNQSKDKTIQELTMERDNLRQALQDAIGSLKDAGKHSKSEQSKVIKDRVAKHIINFTYRNVTFARDEDLRDLTVKIFHELDGRLEDIAHDEFVRIYESHVQECLSQRRQYTQTQLFAAMMSKSYTWV